jgi:hypothetical protein
MLGLGPAPAQAARMGPERYRAGFTMVDRGKALGERLKALRPFAVDRLWARSCSASELCDGRPYR